MQSVFAAIKREKREIINITIKNISPYEEIYTVIAITEKGIESWIVRFKNALIHRDGLPAIEIFINGLCMEEWYYISGHLLSKNMYNKEGDLIQILHPLQK